MSDSATAFAEEIKTLGEKIVGLTLKQAKELSDYLKEVSLQRSRNKFPRKTQRRSRASSPKLALPSNSSNFVPLDPVRGQHAAHASIARVSKSHSNQFVSRSELVAIER